MYPFSSGGGSSGGGFPAPADEAPCPPFSPLPLPHLPQPAPGAPPHGSIRDALSVLRRLDYRTPGPAERAEAVARLEALNDALLLPLAMYLVQALRFEDRVDSALARFLLRRALAAPMPLGWTLY